MPNSSLKNILSLFRCSQWIKNGFVLLPIFFDLKIYDTNRLAHTILACLAFCLISSAIYCLNDICDISKDQAHPIKRNRPLARGAVSVTVAYCSTVFLALISFILAFFTGPNNTIIIGLIGLYFIMNISYCLFLKRFGIIDVIVISIGFVIRLLVGGFSAAVPLSHWIVLMTLLLALFLAFAKRRDDVVMFEKSGVANRRSIRKYNLLFINQVLSILASVTIVCYIMYCISPETTTKFNSQYVYITSIFVIAAILRYLQLTLVDINSGSPTKILLRDRFLHACILGWLITLTIFLYFR